MNIENAGISKTQYSNDNVALLKISTPNGKYGVTIQFANGTNQIATVFKSTDKGIDKWIEKGSANSSTSEPLTSRDKSHTVAVVSQNLNNIISYVKQKLNPTEFINNNIKENFGYSAEELENNFKEDIKNILAENEIDYDEFEIEDVRLYGSYTTGKNKDTSDLDVIVQYKGSMKEDTAFNILNDENLTITDVNGVERKVDINPINRELSGTIDEHIERMHEIDGAYFQSVKTAGAETSAEISEAKKEWEEKGTDSENLNIYYQGANTNYREQLEDAKSNFEYKKFVNKVLSGKLSKQEKRKLFRIGKTPAKLIEAGLPDNTVSIGYKVIEKAQNNKNADHKLSKETISKVWEALKNPIAVIKAEQNENEKKENNRYSAILDLQNDKGEYVLVAFEIDKKVGKGVVVNDIRSIHSRQNYEPIIDKALNDKRLLKVDAEKIRNLLWGSSDLISEGDQASSKKDLLKPKIQSDLISDGVASLIERIAQQKNDVKYYQSVYHGSPHKFDEFSLDAIGTGEGAQAHGWGLYFAGNKDVSEGYRKNLSQSLKNASYDGIPLYKTELSKLHSAISEKLYLKGKVEALKELNRLKEQSENNKNKDGFLGRSSREFLESYNEQLELLNSVDESKITGVNKGQLFEVDIPENDVLLDEDKTIFEQSKKVQEALEDLFFDEFGVILNNSKNITKKRDALRISIRDKYREIDKLENETYPFEKRTVEQQIEIEDKQIEYRKLQRIYNMLGSLNATNSNKNTTGKNIYLELSGVFGSDKKASEFLNSYGIKGIKYNGHKDGECYVVFDDKAVQILNTFYQSNSKSNGNIVDLTDDFETTPTSENVKKYINELVESGKKFATLSPDWFVDVKGGAKKKDHIIKSSNFSKMSKAEKQRHKKFIMSLEKLLANAEYSGEKENTKKSKKPNIAKYHYFTTNVRVGDKIYKVVFDTEEYKNEISSSSANVLRSVKNLDEDNNSITDNAENINPQTVHLYNITEYKPLNQEEQQSLFEGNNKARDIRKIKGSYMPAEKIIDKKMPTHSTIKDNSPSNLIEPTSTNIINDNTSKNNPHTITIRDMLREIKDTENKFYAQENIDNPLDSKRGFSTVRQDFDGTIKENLIVLLKGHADKSTLMHEFAHVYLMTLNQLAKIDAKAQMNLTTINKYLRYNGVEYTEQQHEKFALGFEAYLRAGKAPTYRLKKAFEHFKSWLHSIYNRIEIGDWQEELTLDDETKKVFDQILGDSAYSKKVEKAQELIEKARANANVLMNQEFASKKKIEPMTLTDRQKRYRDTAFDILYTALHNTKDENGKPYINDKKELYMLFSTNKKMKQNNKGVFKRAEKLRFILEELDDPFTGGNYLPEWAEFFGYYDENEMYDSSLALALAALDVIENKKYLYSESELGDFFTDEDLQHIEYECDYLINEFKNSKGDERDVAMLAYWDWIESVPDFVQEDFLNKWQLKTTEIERYENLDKFQQAKEDLILYAQKMKHQGSYSMQFAEFARQIIKRLDFLTIQDKGKMWAKFKDYDSFDAMLRDIDSIMDYAQTIEAVSDRKMMANEIDREVQQTIHEWKNGIKKTKYTYPANKLFERLRQIRKMSMEEIEDVYASMVNEESEITYEADKVHDEDYYKTIEKMYIEFRMNGQYYNSSQFLANLLERIKTAKFTAKVARDEIDFERRMQQINLIDECAKAVNSHKDKVSKLEQIYSAEFNLNSALEMMFNTAVKEKFTLDYLYSQKDAQVGADRDAVLKQIAKVFGLENKKFAEMRLFNIFVNMTKPEFKIRQRYTPDTQLGIHRVTHTDKETGKQVTEQSIAIRPKGEGYKEWEDEEIELSRMQVLYYYIQAKNPTSYKILTDMGDETHPPKGQFDEFEFNDLINQLTPQEKLMGDILQLAAEKYYDKLNQYHIEKYHTELGKVKGYFPRKTSTIQEKVYEPFNDYTQSMSNQRFQKQRTAGAGSRIKPANALEVLFTHIEQANTILIMGKQLDLMNRVFSNPDLKEKIRVVWGDRVQQDFYNQIAGNLFGGQTSALSNAEKDCASMVNNVIKSQIFAKPQVGLKQVMSFMNYGVGDEYVSAGEWWLEFAKQTLTPTQWKKNVEYMMSIPYMKDRFGRGGSQEALKEQLETRFYAKINLLDSIFSAPIRLGDIGAIILGGKPYIDILMRKGYTEEQAQRIFIEKTVNDQQSGIPSTLSNWQRNAGKNPISKMAFAYQNTPHQYFRTAYNSIVRFKQNPNLKTGLDMAKITSIYMYIFPLLFNMASSLSFAIATGQGDDDELWKDIWKSCIGGFTFIPYVGPLINSYWTGLHGEGVYGASDWFTTAANKLNVMARHASKGELTPMDIFFAVALFGEAKTGLPLTALGTELSGVGDIAQGKVAKGLLKVAGFTDYRAKKVTGEDE